MDQAPPVIDRVVVQQPLGWPRAETGQDLVNLGHLFGKMHVDWAGSRLPKDRVQPCGINRTQRMRGQSDGSVRRTTGNDGRGFGVKAQEAIRIVAEPLLPAIQRSQVAAAILVKHWQQCQADPGLIRRRNDPFGHFRERTIGHAAHVVMQIMEFGDRAIASF